jgi:hypothetical protein
MLLISNLMVSKRKKTWKAFQFTFCKIAFKKPEKQMTTFFVGLWSWLSDCRFSSLVTVFYKPTILKLHPRAAPLQEYSKGNSGRLSFSTIFTFMLF